MGVLYLFVCMHICSKNAARSACTLFVKLIRTPMLNHFDVLQAGSLPVAGRCARAVLLPDCLEISLGISVDGLRGQLEEL